MTGNLIIVSAPSGAGKTTLVTEALRRVDNLRASVSYTSRAPREGEINGEHYHFVTEAEFRAMIARDEFLEYAEVHGRLYGTGRAAVEQMLAAGTDVILTIDVQGADNARRLFPEAVGIFIMPPTYEALIARLQLRGANALADQELRLRNARSELEQHHKFDYLVVNDDLEKAARELCSIIIAERCRKKRLSGLAIRILDTFGKSVGAP
ncbi:MAG: guanylate kinase [Blastocatellia bacterium]